MVEGAELAEGAVAEEAGHVEKTWTIVVVATTGADWAVVVVASEEAESVGCIGAFVLAHSRGASRRLWLLSVLRCLLLVCVVGLVVPVVGSIVGCGCLKMMLDFVVGLLLFIILII